MSKDHHFTVEIEYVTKSESNGFKEFKWSQYIELYGVTDPVQAYETALPKYMEKYPEREKCRIKGMGIEYKWIYFENFYDKESYYDYWGVIATYDPNKEEFWKPLLEHLKAKGGRDGRIEKYTKAKIYQASYSIGD